MKFSVALLAASVITGVPRIITAQAPQASPGFATIAGVAVDSIRGGHLRNALVSVTGTRRAALTDSLGRFVIDSIPPGEYALRIRHAVLDSIGLWVLTQPRKLNAGETTPMLIATPGPQTIIATKCPADTRGLGPAAVLGTVFDAETEAPSTGAQVSTGWTELELTRKSLLQVPKHRTATVAADGSFRLCGLPSDLSTGIRAARGSDTTAAVRLDLASGLAIVALYLPKPSPGGGRAVVVGRITDVNNQPVVGARAVIEEDRITSTTGADGQFRIAGAKSGTRTLAIRKLGYQPTQMTVELREGDPFSADLKLAAFVPILETVTISAIRDEGLRRNGFAQRRNRGVGTFITAEDIARRNPIRINDMLRGVGFLRFIRGPYGRDVIAGRPSVASGSSGCVRYFVDNVMWMSPDDSPDEFYHPREIAAIEVYRPTLAPAHFMSMSARGELCTVIVLWTQTGLRRR